MMEATITEKLEVQATQKPNVNKDFNTQTYCTVSLAYSNLLTLSQNYERQITPSISLNI